MKLEIIQKAKAKSEKRAEAEGKQGLRRELQAMKLQELEEAAGGKLELKGRTPEELARLRRIYPNAGSIELQQKMIEFREQAAKKLAAEQRKQVVGWMPHGFGGKVSERTRHDFTESVDERLDRGELLRKRSENVGRLAAAFMANASIEVTVRVDGAFLGVLEEHFPTQGYHISELFSETEVLEELLQWGLGAVLEKVIQKAVQAKLATEVAVQLEKLKGGR